MYLDVLKFESHYTIPDVASGRDDELSLRVLDLLLGCFD
jgi:hypothetical protein